MKRETYINQNSRCVSLNDRGPTKKSSATRKIRENTVNCNIKRVLKRLWKLMGLDSCCLANARKKKHCKEGQKSITLSSLKRFVSYHQITILEWFSHGMSSAWFPWPQNVRHQNQKRKHIVNSPKNNSAPSPCHLERNVLHFTIAILTQDRQRGGHRTTNFHIAHVLKQCRHQNLQATRLTTRNGSMEIRLILERNLELETPQVSKPTSCWT